MSPESPDPLSERQQTDESLRAERDKADHVLADELSLVEETADAVITKARARADDVLAAARARVDQRSMAPPPGRVAMQRDAEDAALDADRADADEVVREERAQQVALLAAERDETDRDLLVERARADDATATRNDFVGLVSHDLRSLLHSMSGYAGLIETMASPDASRPEVALYAQRIQRAGRRMNRLIGDLVDVASTEAGALRVTREVGEPSLIVTEAVEGLHPQALAAGLSLTAEIVPPTPAVSFDAPRILQVLTNLLSNAIKFTPRGGAIVVRLERAADELRFSVRDTGIGIPPEKLEAIFERFIQVVAGDRRGLGLGLYISKCIVQGHEGRIWAESALERGSCITFALPIHPEA